MTEPGPRFLLKDLFNWQSVGAIANSVHAVMPTFDRDEFATRVFGPAGGAWTRSRVRRLTISPGPAALRATRSTGLPPDPGGAGRLRQRARFPAPG